MPERSPFGLTLVLIGVVLVAIGVLAWAGALSWFGRLPGDIRVERPGVRFYMPITSLLLASFALTLLASLFRRFWP